MGQEASQVIEEQFIQAYEEHADAIFRHCYFRISDRERAKELTEEAFMRTWQYLVEGKKLDNIRAFLYRIANNLIVDEYRRKRTGSLEALQEAGFDPEDSELPADFKSELSRVLGLLDKLDAKYKEVVVLRYVDDLAVKEIAEMIGESENVVSVRINRAIKQLRSLLRT